MYDNDGRDERGGATTASTAVGVDAVGRTKYHDVGYDFAEQIHDFLEDYNLYDDWIALELGPRIDQNENGQIMVNVRNVDGLDYERNVTIATDPVVPDRGCGDRLLRDLPCCDGCAGPVFPCRSDTRLSSGPLDRGKRRLRV